MDTKRIIRESLTAANAKRDKGSSERIKHRNRSKMFVESLAMKLREYYAGEGIFVLSRHSPDHRREFGLNELLYDILVCKTDQVRSRSENGNLTYVTGAIWQEIGRA